MKRLLLLLSCFQFMVSSLVHAGDGKPSTSTVGTSQSKPVTSVHTENYPRPPYSGATYYIYERNGQVICTKLEVCNKFNQCETSYTKGPFKDEEDVQTGDPYEKTPAVVISNEKLNKHVCLLKFHLN